MPAGTKYDKELNKDTYSVKTPSFYDTNLDEWLMASANVVKTEGGLFIFQKGTDAGRAKVDAEVSVAIPAGANVVGKFGIDQTTPGTTNKVVAGIDQTSDGTTNKVQAFQPTHDNLNANANLQVGNADVGPANPIPATLSGSNAYQSGNPYPIAKDCVIANTNYDIDVNAGLTRNGHFGLIQAHENNTGVVSVWISFNGTTFTASAIARLQAGDALSLDGLDIDTIRVQSTIAGDDVLGGVW